MGGRRICPDAKTALSAFLVITHSWPLSSVDSSLQNFVPLFPFPFYPHCSTPSVHSLSRDHCRTRLTQCPHLYKSSLIMSLFLSSQTSDGSLETREIKFSFCCKATYNTGSLMIKPTYPHLYAFVHATPSAWKSGAHHSFQLAHFYLSLKVQLKYHFLSSFFTHPLCSQPQDELLHNLCSQRTSLIPLSQT